MRRQPASGGSRRRRKSKIVPVLLVLLAVFAGTYLWVRKEFDSARLLIQRSAQNRYPPHLQAAFVAAEDPAFFQRGRFDVLRTIRGTEQPSLTAQLVRGVIPRQGRPLLRQVKDSIVVLLLNLTCDKEAVLTTYLANVYLGRVGDRLLHGVDAASRGYFGKGPDELDVAQSAMLAGLARNPQLYSPTAHPENARKRRDEVLRLMQQRGALTEADLANALKRPVPRRVPNARGD